MNRIVFLGRTVRVEKETTDRTNNIFGYEAKAGNRCSNMLTNKSSSRDAERPVSGTASQQVLTLVPTDN